MYNIKGNLWMKVKLHSLLTLALDGYWVIFTPRLLYKWENFPWYLLKWRLCVPQNFLSTEKSLVSAKISRSSCPSTCHSTDWRIPASYKMFQTLALYPFPQDLGKLNSELEQGTKAQSGSTGIALLFPWPRRLKRVGGQRHAPAALPLGKIRCPLFSRLGGPQGRLDGCKKISPAPGFDPPSVQPVASRYSDWALPVHHLRKISCQECFVNTFEYAAFYYSTSFIRASA